jgi:hypothetical protein
VSAQDYRQGLCEGEMNMLRALKLAADDIGRGWLDRRRANAIRRLVERLWQERFPVWERDLGGKP